MTPLAPETIEAMRSWLLENRYVRDATLVSVLAYAGLRPSEALALTWAHVRDRTLLVERAASLGAIEGTKTGRRRTVPLLKPLAQDLGEWRLHAGHPDPDVLVFPGHDGEPWTLTAYQNWRRRIYTPAARAAGVERPRPYDLRHSFVSRSTPTRGERSEEVACALQARDLEILALLARVRFLTTGQIAELWWEGKGLRAVRRRMTRLFEAGFVERFRPQTLRGSYQWTYCLARDGFRAAERPGELPAGLKFAPRRERIFDYRYVLHDLRVNEWVLRYREHLQDRLLDWGGPDESRFEPPKQKHADRLRDHAYDILRHSGWYPQDIDTDFFRPVQPDAFLHVEDGDHDVPVFVEYDRTRRVDKNFDKFLRYETLVSCWWRTTDLAWPVVVFVCQDADHQWRFLDVADCELCAQLYRDEESGSEERYPARERFYFAVETDLRDGDMRAIQLPTLPRAHEERPTPGMLKQVPLPGLKD